MINGRKWWTSGIALWLTKWLHLRKNYHQTIVSCRHLCVREQCYHGISRILPDSNFNSLLHSRGTRPALWARDLHGKNWSNGRKAQATSKKKHMPDIFLSKYGRGIYKCEREEILLFLVYGLGAFQNTRCWNYQTSLNVWLPGPSV